MISMLTLMADVEPTIRQHPDKRINSIALDSPYDAAKTMLAVMATHGLIVYVVTRSNLYVHAPTVGLLKYMDGSRGFWIVHRNRVLAESHAVNGSWESFCDVKFYNQVGKWCLHLSRFWESARVARFCTIC